MKEIIFDKLDSTHIFLKNNYNKYENEIAIIANTQTSGIGTRDRKWYTGENKNIAMSVLYKKNLEIDKLNGLTKKIALEIQSNIFKKYNICLDIKEPNDVYLNNKKISGILTEIHTQGNTVKYVIISIGFNVNETQFDEDTCNIATSLKKEFNHEFNIIEIRNLILNTISELLKK